MTAAIAEPAKEQAPAVPVEVHNVREAQGVAVLRPIITAAALIEAHKEVADLVNRVLQEGTDYGVIPGTGSKPALLKPGAERLSVAFGLRPEFDVLEEEVDHFREVPWYKRKKQWRNAHPGDKSFTWVEETGVSTGFYRYVIRCRLIRRETGEEMGQGVGCCSTLESKYVDRPRDSENTALKMAKKRAHVDAVLTTLGLSDRFTQDVEDQRPEHVDADGVVHEAPAQGKGRSRTNGSAASETSKATPGSGATDKKAIRLPGGTGKWYGHAGKLLTDVPFDILERARTYYHEKNPQRDAALVDAIDNELEVRRTKDYSKPDATSPAKAEQASLAEVPPALASKEDDDLPF